jgi:hypothetical protein
MDDELSLLGGMVRAPKFLPTDEIAKCETYRQAVRLSWANRRRMAMTKEKLAEELGTYPSHVSDYLNKDDKPTRRNVPPHKLDRWAEITGNWAVHQWLARQVKLTFMEEVLAQRAA